MFLDYLALAILIMGICLVFYTFIFIHEIPHKIAMKRNHPHAEAIGVAGWLSLFTVHAIWPIVFIWAVAHKKQEQLTDASAMEDKLADRLARIEQRLQKIESTTK